MLLLLILISYFKLILCILTYKFYFILFLECRFRVRVLVRRAKKKKKRKIKILIRLIHISACRQKESSLIKRRYVLTQTDHSFTFLFFLSFQSFLFLTLLFLSIPFLITLFLLFFFYLFYTPHLSFSLLPHHTSSSFLSPLSSPHFPPTPSHLLSLSPSSSPPILSPFLTSPLLTGIANISITRELERIRTMSRPFLM